MNERIRIIIVDNINNKKTVVDLPFIIRLHLMQTKNSIVHWNVKYTQSRNGAAKSNELE